MDDDGPHRRVSAGILAATSGAEVLVVGGLLLRNRLPDIDSWGLETLYVVPGSTAETIASVVSDGLRIASLAGAVAAVGW